MLKISPSAVGMYEQGRREPALDILAAMAEIFGVTIDFLVTGKAGNTEENIAIPVIQQDRFFVNELEPPMMMYTGQDNYIDVVFINKGTTDVYYPGGYETVVCVGACNTKGTEVPSFSNVSGTVDLVAPGLALTLADLQGGTVIASGTSFSCAYVSAATARLLMEDPTLTAPQLRELLYETAKDIGPTGYDPQSGWGVLDMEAALARLERAPLALPDVSPEDYYHDAAHWAV